MIEHIQKALQSLTENTTGTTLSVNSVPWEDWNARWAASVKPIGIGQRIVIRPSWETVAVPPNGLELIIDPKQAFRTGHHATTQLLIEWLEDLIQGGETVLDVGTGSGILAMVALRLGATSTLGIDNDPIAIDCARGYAGLNGFQDELDLCSVALEEIDLNKFKVILANLDAQTILENRRRFSQYCATNGTLLLSEILREDHEEILQAFSFGRMGPARCT